MRILKRFEDLARFPLRNAVVTLGTFDGMHRGHQKVIRQAVLKARKWGGPSVVLTYADHPLKILFPERVPPLITPIEEKLELMEHIGVKFIVIIPFTKNFSKIPAEKFILDIVCRSLEAKEFCVGPDTTFGEGGKGNPQLLREIGRDLGFQVTVVPRVYVGKKPVSSTVVRQAIGKADFAAASRLLNRPYSVRGHVIRGEGRGRDLGFPTANVTPQNELLPPHGVYAVWLNWRGRFYNGILNWGRCPTLPKKKRNHPPLEVHLFDFKKQLYGEPVEIFFYRKLRRERKFSSVQALTAQISKDAARARQLLAI